MSKEQGVVGQGETGTDQQAKPRRRLFSREELAAGEHRRKVGGRWEKIGGLQFDFMVKQGLTPSSLMLDVGCGSLRGGIHYIRYLQPGHYFGLDRQARLIEAGWYELEQAGLTGRLPKENLLVTRRFECDFGVRFDFALAQSVFSHAPLNQIRLCLHRVGQVMKPGGRFFATFYEAPADVPYDQPVEQGKGAPSYPEKEPFHYRYDDLVWAATVGPWKARYIGRWGHPRGQRMIEFRRI